MVRPASCIRPAAVAGEAAADLRRCVGDGAVQRRATLVAGTSNGRAGRPADIAATVLFLASPGAGHITGQVLHVNGGFVTGR